MACDICGKVGTGLIDLREVYQTDSIKAICPECEKVVNEKLRELQKVTVKIQFAWLKNFMQERKSGN